MGKEKHKLEFNKINTLIKPLSEKVKRRPILFVFLILLCYFFIFPAGRNYDGYCSNFGRKLTDNEKIHFAIKDLLSAKRIYLDKKIENIGDQNSTKITYYKSTDDFLEKNPNCCKVIHGLDTFKNHNDSFLDVIIFLLDRITKFNSSDAVYIKYKAEFFNKNSPEIKSLFIQSQCGITVFAGDASEWNLNKFNLF